MVAWGFLLVFFTAGADIPGLQDVTQALAILLVMTILVVYGPSLMSVIGGITDTVKTTPGGNILQQAGATTVAGPAK
jgi:hypothetical protein